jgi:hypothetical protein
LIAAILMTLVSGAAEQAPLARQISHCREILSALRTFASDHDGEYPVDLKTLATDGVIQPENLKRILKVMNEDGGTAGEWILLQGLNDDSAHWLVLVASPPLHRSDGSVARILGLNDGSVTVIKESDFEEVLKEKGQRVPIQKKH